MKREYSILRLALNWMECNIWDGLSERIQSHTQKAVRFSQSVTAKANQIFPNIHCTIHPQKNTYPQAADINHLGTGCSSTCFPITSTFGPQDGAREPGKAPHAFKVQQPHKASIIHYFPAAAMILEGGNGKVILIKCKETKKVLKWADRQCLSDRGIVGGLSLETGNECSLKKRVG